MGGRELAVFFGVMALGLAMIITPIIFLGNYLEEGQCANQAAVMGVEYRYSINMPCMVKVDGRFIPLKSMKVVQ